MSWSSPPHATSVVIPDAQQCSYPHEAYRFLESRGWMSQTNTQEGMVFTHPRHSGYYTWSEAIALEFMHFITLGGDRG